MCIAVGRGNNSYASKELLNVRLCQLPREKALRTD